MKFINSIKSIWNKHTELSCLAITAFFLFAGVLQYAFGLNYVIALTPLVVGLIAAVVLLFWDVPHKRRLISALVAISIGMIVEIIGVNTGILFGNYEYGEVLGLQLFGVPILIGITWLLVTVSAWQIVQLSNFDTWAKIIIGGGLVVTFDLLLEQFATAFGLWSWQNGVIPIKNYLTWLLVSLVLFVFYAIYTKQKKVSLYGAGALPLIVIFFWLMLVTR